MEFEDACGQFELTWEGRQFSHERLGLDVNMYTCVCKNMTYFIIKLRFAGISEADQAGLEKPQDGQNLP